MPPSNQNFFLQYKKAIITAIIGVIIAGGIPTTMYIHNAWGDDRYVQKTQDLRDQIQAIDNAMFEIDQEISFSTDPRDKAKWEARMKYYERQKEALAERLKAQNTA